MKKLIKNLRKMRVLGIVIMIVGIIMFITCPDWAATGISTGDSGWYILTTYFCSIVVFLLGAVLTFLG